RDDATCRAGAYGRVAPRAVGGAGGGRSRPPRPAGPHPPQPRRLTAGRPPSPRSKNGETRHVPLTSTVRAIVGSQVAAPRSYRVLAGGMQVSGCAQIVPISGPLGPIPGHSGARPRVPVSLT